jgi:hypothetical protein
LKCRKPLPLLKRWGDCRRTGYCSKECSAFQPAVLARSTGASTGASLVPFSSPQLAVAAAEDAAAAPLPPPPKTSTARQPRARPIPTLQALCISNLADNARVLTDIGGIGETLGVRAHRFRILTASLAIIPPSPTKCIPTVPCIRALQTRRLLNFPMSKCHSYILLYARFSC